MSYVDDELKIDDNDEAEEEEDQDGDGFDVPLDDDLVDDEDLLSDEFKGLDSDTTE